MSEDTLLNAGGSNETSGEVNTDIGDKNEGQVKDSQGEGLGATAPEETSDASSKTTEEASTASSRTTEETSNVSDKTIEEVVLQDLISEELRDSSNLKDFKNVDDLAKSYIELQRMVGNSVRIPAEDASAEARQDFLDKIKDVEGVLVKDDEHLYNKLGRPEDPDGYNLSASVEKDLADQMPGLESEIEEYQKVVHELGLTKKQAEGLMDRRMQIIKEVAQSNHERAESTETSLRKKWGDDYENRLDAARKVCHVYAEDYGEDMSSLLDGPAGNNPAFISILAELAESYTEKKHKGMSGTQFGMTPDGAANKIQEKKSDRGFMEAYNDAMHPGHEHAVSEMMKLYSIAETRK